jgi:hypothetical protein
VKLVEEVLAWDAEIEKEKISLRKLSIIPYLRGEIRELQMRRHEFQEFKEKEIKRKDSELRIDNRVMYLIEWLCVMDFGDQWIDNLPYAKLAYNNSYETFIEMTPFEALYGQKCQVPLYWDWTEEGHVNKSGQVCI